ncbi:MAG: hypothetical protein ACXW05_07685 [Gemmatirosa sp.]
MRAHRTTPLAALALLGAAACHDQPTHAADAYPSTTPRLAIADAARGGTPGFYWLTPTVPTAPATFPGAFDAAALPALAVEVCALDAAGDACLGARVARYTATTSPSAQQLRADTVRQHYVVYWNTSVSTGAAVTAGRRYRARVVRTAAGATRELGFTDVQVVASSGELSGVDRTRYAAIVRGQQLTLRFRVEAAPPDENEMVPASLVREVAERLVATVATDDSAAVEREVAGILGAFVPLYGVAQLPAAMAQLASGRPAGFDFQVTLIARALREGSRTSVDSFLAAASAAGASRHTGGAISRATLAAALAPLAARTEHPVGEVLPATVLAISRARAAGAAGADPVWGDGQLVALQTTLLRDAVHLAGDEGTSTPAASARPVASRAAAATIAGGGLPSFVSPGKMLLNFKTGLVGREIGMPLTWFQAVPASVCASVLMNSYRFRVEATPTTVARRGLDLPTASDAVAQLSFDFTPNAAGAQVLSAIGCVLPPFGAAPGKGVQWSLRGELPAHGAIEAQGAVTDATGRARARYATIEEVVPEAMRALAKEATGTLDVRATGLVPGWSSLEKSVGAGVLNPTDAGVRLAVKHYEWPRAVQVEFEAGFIGRVLTATSQWDVGQRASFRLTRREHATAMEYYGEGPAAYTHYRPTGSVNGCALQPAHTVSGRLGFGLVAFPAGNTGGLLGMINVVEPIAIEHWTAHCPPPAPPAPIQSSVGGFGLLASAVYGPVEPGPLLFLSRNPVSEWQVVRPGVLRGVQSRTVSTVIGPVQEQSTFTLTLIP